MWHKSIIFEEGMNMFRQVYGRWEVRVVPYATSVHMDEREGKLELHYSHEGVRCVLSISGTVIHRLIINISPMSDVRGYTPGEHLNVGNIIGALKYFFVTALLLGDSGHSRRTRDHAGRDTFNQEDAFNRRWRPTDPPPFEEERDFFKEFHSQKKQEQKQNESSGYAGWKDQAAFEEFFRKFGTGGGPFGFDFDDTMFGGSKRKSGPSGQQQQQQQQKQKQQQQQRQQSSGPSTEKQLNLKILMITIESPTWDQVKKAWKQMCMIWHPDRNSHRVAEAERKMKEINGAYEALKPYYAQK